MKESLTLYELNHLIQKALESEMSDIYWVQAELSEVRVASNGHCYVELVQKDDIRDRIQAKARGIIWANIYSLLSSYFEKETGLLLAPGMKVLVAVKVSFHELYGLSLVITDINPTYTLGDMIRRRQDILFQLEKDGVLTLNKELRLPRLIQRIAVISSGTAAGYGDFCNQLENSPYRFVVKLFPAVMQGEQVEQSVINALNQIYKERDKWDVVAILRGGGSVSDLSGFDTYLLATNCAQFPLPILTGIGHERDDTVVDCVAHTRLKTPTAVAAFLVDKMAIEVNVCDVLRRRLVECACARLTNERSRMEKFSLGLPAVVHWRITQAHVKLERVAMKVNKETLRREKEEYRRLERYESIFKQSVLAKLKKERMRLRLISQGIKISSPEHLFRLGFSITMKNGRTVVDSSQIKADDLLITRIAHGVIRSKVIGVVKKNE